MKTGVVIDTSVWIDFFRGALPAKHKEAVLALLESEQATITDIIKHEILVGTNSKKDFLFLSESLSALNQISLDPALFDELNRFGFELKMKGLIGKYTDLSIAFLAHKHNLPIFSYDKYFAKLAQKNIVSVVEF